MVNDVVNDLRAVLPAVLAGILLFQEEAGPLDPPFWRHICGTLFGLPSTTIYLAILLEKV